MYGEGFKILKMLFILVALCLPGFFFAKNCLAKTGVIINEVAWAGSIDSANDEWIELYNNSSFDVSLDGWKLVASDGSPQIELSGDVAAKSYFLLERTNDDSAPPGADMFFSGSLGNDGERLSLLNGSGEEVDFVDASSGWTAGDNTNKTTAEFCGQFLSSSLPGGTPKKSNSCSAQVVASSSSNQDDERILYRFGDVLINEFFPIPADGGDEWVELYYQPGAFLDLSDWYVVDGSGAKTVLSGFFSGGNRFFLVKKIKGSLNNSGDEINLFSYNGNLIDRVVYGAYGSSSKNNAPLPNSGCSAALKNDGQRSSYFSESFTISCSPTPGGANKIVAPSAKKASTSQDYYFGITEILVNPNGSDRDGEFIEFYNFSEIEIDISGWRLLIEGGKELEFGKNFLPAIKVRGGDFFVLYRRDSLATLDNDGGKIELFPPGKKTPSQILEYPAIKEGQSFVDSYIVNSSSSAVTKNFLKNVLVLDRWVLSDLATPGAANEIWSENRGPLAKFSFSAESEIGKPILFDASDSIDEDGDDLSFSWDFGDGVKAGGENPAHIFIKGGEYNIKLLVSDGLISDVVEKSVLVFPLPLGASDSSVKNIAIPLKEESSVNKRPLSNDWLFAGSVDKYAEIEINNFYSAKIGDLVSFSGQVLVPPNIFGRQYFYIFSSTSLAVKIYSYKGDFPTLAVGDIVNVKGEVSGTSDKYLKISSLEDVAKRSSGSLPLPEKKSGELLDGDVGHFLEMDGIVSKSDGKIFLSSSSSDVRIFLKSSVVLNSGDFESGQRMSVSGLVVSTPTGISLAPRGREDIFVFRDNEGSVPESSELGKRAVAGGATTSPREWVLPPAKSSNPIITYALIVVSGTALFLLFLLIKRRKG
jgi:PKD repeat protein